MRVSYQRAYGLSMSSTSEAPKHLDLKKDKGLAIEWHDGTSSYYSIAYLRRMSPSADVRELRKAMAQNQGTKNLTVIPQGQILSAGEITATDAELVGNYAIRIKFSDGHTTGIYSWTYLREIDPALRDMGEDTLTAPGDDAPPHHRPLGL